MDVPVEKEIFMFHRVGFSLFCFVIVFCVFAVFMSAHAGEEKPVAVFEAAPYDFGAVFEGQEVTHDFIIKNTGSADLEIKDVKAG
jgi:hypothetical protein